MSVEEVIQCLKEMGKSEDGTYADCLYIRRDSAIWQALRRWHTAPDILFTPMHALVVIDDTCIEVIPLDSTGTIRGGNEIMEGRPEGLVCSALHAAHALPCQYRG